MASLLACARSHVSSRMTKCLCGIVYYNRIILPRFRSAAIVKSYSSTVSERIEKKKEEALVGGGLRRIDVQHERVGTRETNLLTMYFKFQIYLRHLDFFDISTAISFVSHKYCNISVNYNLFYLDAQARIVNDCILSE